MKTMLVALSLTISFVTHSAEAIDSKPLSIECTLETGKFTNYLPWFKNKLVFIDVLSKNPKHEIPKNSLNDSTYSYVGLIESPEVVDGKIEISYSDFCEKWLSATFDYNELTQLQSKRAGRIIGDLEVNDLRVEDELREVYSEEEMEKLNSPDLDQIILETKIICKKL
ncbi:MAG: hypothetical protein HOE90_09000 [Bacteriovoracaceae bacterium]|nr:hypothetical protein [Bacteriovoracaceae bacterium]